MPPWAAWAAFDNPLCKDISPNTQPELLLQQYGIWMLLLMKHLENCWSYVFLLAALNNIIILQL